MIRYTGWKIPEGNVVQVTDESGAVIWAVSGGDKVILQVEKITSDTYAGETTYTGEQFILLDIYPKTNGTVTVTYGGLTKTITDTSGAAEPNAQQVVFGTFNGVTHDTSPANGELAIEGKFYAFGCGSFSSSSKNTGYCGCITAINDFGGVTSIPSSAFRLSGKLTIQELPEGIESIGDFAFAMPAESKATSGNSQYSLTWGTAMEGGTIILPSTIKSIGDYAFASSRGLTSSSGGSADTYPCYLAKVKILATEPPTLGTNPFGTRYSFYNDVNYKAIFEVPKGCVDKYKNAEGWSFYANEIVEAS